MIVSFLSFVDSDPVRYFAQFNESGILEFNEDAIKQYSVNVMSDWFVCSIWDKLRNINERDYILTNDDANTSIILKANFDKIILTKIPENSLDFWIWKKIEKSWSRKVEIYEKIKKEYYGNLYNNTEE